MRLSARVAAASAGATAALVMLTGCISGERETSPVPTVTITAPPTAAADGSGFSGVDISDFIDDKAVSFVCGEFSALSAIQANARSAFDRGSISAEAYGALLERQAFQLSNLDASEPVLTEAVNAIRSYLATTPSTPEAWAYDTSTPEWSAAHAGLANACDAAGASIGIAVEPGMGG